MNWIEVVIGGGFVTFLTGLVTVYRSLKEGASKDREHQAETLQKWNEDVVSRLERVTTQLDECREELASCKEELVELRLYIKSKGLPLPGEDK
ncbi:hypothetical protein O1L55_20785 [Streptomyces albulus]|nr:hypothetical protein [Streptomyces noursei]